MIPLVEFPELIGIVRPFKEASSDDAFIEFERYISGLIVSENKTMGGINRLFVNETCNQSSLNRLLTQTPTDRSKLNKKWLELLEAIPGTRMKPKGASAWTTPY
jgi:hypothetical protein